MDAYLKRTFVKYTSRNLKSQMILRDGLTQFLLDSRIGWRCVAGTAGCGLGMRSAPAYLTVSASTHLCIVDGRVGVWRGWCRECCETCAV